MHIDTGSERNKMIRENIFKLHRHLPMPSSSAQKIDFTFSNIQALQVPKGWDKLCLSLISSATGKIVKKSGKGSVKNGTCRWTEILSKSIWISDLDGSEEREQYIFTFLIAMGSSSSGILGEATVNLPAFLSSDVPVLVSLPLKRCNYGTILHVEIKCLTPKTSDREEKWKVLNAPKHENTNHNHDLDDEFEVAYNFSIAKRSSDKFSTASYRPREFGSQEMSSSASVSSCSFDSIDETIGRQSLSFQNNFITGNYAVRRQDSVDSHDSMSYSSYTTLDSPQSDTSFHNPLAKNQRDDFIRKSSLQPNSDSPETLKEVDDSSTVEEQRAEAKMWEQNARKLDLEVEALKKELNDQCLNAAELNTKLAKSNSDCRKLREEIKNLDMDLDQKHEMKMFSSQKEEMEDEIRFQRQLIENLSLQLKKTQESNIELISILQEMEEMKEEQKMDLESRSKEKNRCIRGPTIINDELQNLEYSDSGSVVSGMSETDIDVVQDSQCEILCVEHVIEDKIIETEIEQDVKNQIMKECEEEWRCILAVKDQEIMKLESELSKVLCGENCKCNVDTSKEIKHLEEKIKELETDCNELTEENLQLLLQLKEIRKGSCKFDEEEKDMNTMSDKCGSKLQENDEVIDRDSRISSKKHLSKIHGMRLMEAENKQIPLLEHLLEIEEENVYLSGRISGLEAQLRYITEENESNRLELQHSESEVVNLRNEILKLEEEIETQKVCTKKKMSEMENRWTEAQEECTSLSKLNLRLQTTIESLIEDNNSLQKYNEELKEQKLKLQEQCIVLQEKFRKSQHSPCNYSDENFAGKNSLTEEKSCSGEEEKPKKLYAEEELKCVIDDLDLRIKVSEIERIRLVEENTILHMGLEKVPFLHNEVIDLRMHMKEMRTRNQILEASLKSVSVDYEKLKCESTSMLETISMLQKTASETEDCKSKNVALQEKILRMEGELMANDALRIQDTEMRNKIKRVNTQLQIKLKNLEDIKEELQRKVQYLEEELKKIRQEKEDKKDLNSSCRGLKLSKEEEDEDEYWGTDQNNGIICDQIQVSNNQIGCFRRCHESERDCESKIKLLEKELVRALKANESYEAQLDRATADALLNPQSKEKNDTSRNKKYKISVLEGELQEIRERYLEISLKYAEVEAQRENLVMELKSLNSGNSFPQRW